MATRRADSPTEARADVLRQRGEDFRVPAEVRLRPCAVELLHTTYDEETREPRPNRFPILRLVSRWSAELRDTEWHEVAPIPLTLEQARTLLYHPVEQPVASTVVVATDLDEGVLQYQFDANGRTVRVRWDPVADSSDYVFGYRYDCPTAGPGPEYVP